MLPLVAADTPSCRRVLTYGCAAPFPLRPRGFYQEPLMVGPVKASSTVQIKSQLNLLSGLFLETRQAVSPFKKAFRFAVTLCVENWTVIS